MQFHPTFYYTCGYLSMLALRLNHVSKRAQYALVPYWLFQIHNKDMYTDTTKEGKYKMHLYYDNKHHEVNSI